MNDRAVSALVDTLPYALSEDEKQVALAKATAEEIIELINNLDLLTIYNRIDTLDEDLLDILAQDFKIDWWDTSGTIAEKRQALKRHWQIHRILGTPEALKLAFASIYDSATLKAWNEYGGRPYHFKLFVDILQGTPDYDKLVSLVERFKFYSNVRSKFDGAVLQTEKKSKLFFGAALQNGQAITLTTAAVDPESFVWLLDELENDLVDENGLLLFD